MKIGFHYHVPAENRSGGVYMPGYLGRFIDGLAERVGLIRLFMHAPSKSQIGSLDYRLVSKNVEFVSLGEHCSVPKRASRFLSYRHIIINNSNDLDLVLVRSPTPLMPVIASMESSIPFSFLMVGSYADSGNDSPHPLWRKILIRMWVSFYERMQSMALKNRLVFVNSQKLFDELKKSDCDLVLTRTTTLNSEDFFQRDDTCQGKSIKLLYAGRFDLAKGLIETIDAVAVLLRSGFNVTLDMVGWDESTTDVMQNIVRHAEKLGISAHVQFHPRKSVGDELFSFYRAADIFVVASKSNFEGFPRTMWEAMAHSVPIVATKVGSIPAYASEIARLVEPNDVESLASGLRDVITDSGLRMKMIRNGYASAKENTIQARSDDMVKHISAWVEKNRKFQ